MKYLSLAAVLAVTIFSAPAMAEERLDFSLGGWDFFKDAEDGAHNNIQLVGAAEYRSEYFWKKLRWDAGLMVTNQSAQYVYAGFGYDIFLDSAHHFVITPNEAVGLYNEGAGKDLGGALEFKSGIEAAYQFDGGQRLGVSIHHISNAHIYDKNPGTEMVMAHYSMPFTLFGGQ